MAETGKHICTLLETVFQEIGETRMKGIPILNTALSVKALGFDAFQDYQLGVLLTPWFMNLMLLPADAQIPLRVGDKKNITLPAGQIEFIVGHEDRLGSYLSCSLFSPMFEFQDQEAAIQTAQSALIEVLNTDSASLDDDSGMRDIWEGRLPEPEAVEKAQAPSAQDLNRRDFLRGAQPQNPVDADPKDQP